MQFVVHYELRFSSREQVNRIGSRPIWLSIRQNLGPGHTSVRLRRFIETAVIIITIIIIAIINSIVSLLFHNDDILFLVE